MFVKSIPLTKLVSNILIDTIFNEKFYGMAKLPQWTVKAPITTYSQFFLRGRESELPDAVEVYTEPTSKEIMEVAKLPGSYGEVRGLSEMTTGKVYIFSTRLLHQYAFSAIKGIDRLDSVGFIIKPRDKVIGISEYNVVDSREYKNKGKFTFDQVSERLLQLPQMRAVSNYKIKKEFS